MATSRDRINWLKKRPALWEGWAYNAEGKRWRSIVTYMKQDGLISASTNWKDVNIPNLITDIRNERYARIACTTRACKAKAEKKKEKIE